MTDSEIIEQYGWISQSLARKWAGMPVALDRDDLVQVGNIELLKAYRKWRADGTASFSTFAWRCVKWAIAGEIKRMNWSRYSRKHIEGREVVPSNPQHVFVDENENAWVDGAYLVEDDTTGPYVEWLLSQLSPRQRQVVELRMEGNRNVDIAVVLGLEPGTVDNMMPTIRDRLEQAIAGQYERPVEVSQAKRNQLLGNNRERQEQASERRLAVWQLREEGTPLKVIAHTFGVSHWTILDDVKREKIRRGYLLSPEHDDSISERAISPSPLRESA